MTGLLTLLASGVAVVAQDQTPAPLTVTTRQDVFAASQDISRVSRSAERAPLPNDEASEKRVKGTLFAVKPVQIHAAAKDSAPVLAKVKSGQKVDVTGVTDGPWTQIMHNDLPRWVLTTRLAKHMPPPPRPPAPPPVGTGPCPGGSAVEQGLQPDTIKVHRAVCAAFPSVVRWGGRTGGGEHASGRALDIMTGTAVGDQIAAFAQAHWRELGVSQVIWRQRIWTVERAGDGWRPMPNRGSATANHMDHVHVTTFGSSATG